VVQTSPDDLAPAIRQQLDDGTSLDDVIAQLAGSLASGMAAQLGISDAAALQKLEATFRTALGSGGTGPPQTNAERAAALASRFRQIADLATRVTKDDPGQPIRSIAGTSLDADTAKANPTPATTDDLVRDAQNALAATASSSASAVSSGLTPVAPAASNASASAQGDGRVVASSSPAIAANGDTLIGRILARAMQADTQRTSAVETAPDAAKTSDAAPPAPSTTASATAQPGSQALDAFLHAFATALARSDADAPGGKDGAPAAAASAINATATAPGAQNAGSFAAALAPQHAVATSQAQTPAASASPAPSTQSDPNAIVDQVLRGVAVHVGDSSSEVRLRLVPEQLGDVSVKLVVSGGAVNATITAHSAEAQSALAGAQPQLAKTLADAGLKLQSFSVALAGGNSSDAREQSHAQSDARRSAARRIGAVGAASSDDDQSDASLLASPSFGPPIYAAAPGALDYLA